MEEKPYAPVGKWIVHGLSQGTRHIGPLSSALSVSRNLGGYFRAERSWSLVLDKYGYSEGLCEKTVITRLSFFELRRHQRCKNQWDLVLVSLWVLEMKKCLVGIQSTCLFYPGNLDGVRDFA